MLGKMSEKVLQFLGGLAHVGSSVREDEVGGPSFFLQRPLTRLALLKFLTAPPAAGGHALFADGPRGLDEHQRVAKIIPSSFEQNGSVNQDRLDFPFAFCLIDQLAHPSSDFRMHDRFQVPECLLVARRPAENRSRQRSAIDLAPGIENRIPETVPQLLPDMGQRQGVMAKGVRVDHQNVASTSQPSSNRAFPRSNSSDQSNDRNPPFRRHRIRLPCWDHS